MQSLRLWFSCVLLLTGLLCFGGGRIVAEESTTEVQQRLSAAFAQADANHDSRQSLDEFLAGRDHLPLAKRDFRLCDFNDDGLLTFEEFLTVPIVVAPQRRGPLPDIIAGLVEQIVAALDAACDDWDKDPQRELNSRQFLAAITSQMQQLGAGLMRPDFNEVDPDKNGTVTRAEARRFIEIQMGVRRKDGTLLRFPNGQVINFMLFEHIDENKDDKLSRKEFVERSYGDATVAAEFERVDIDQNGFVSFDEWSVMNGRAVCDPVEEFRKMDTNLDARVDAMELLAGTPDWQQMLAKHVFPGFDWNKDGVLSLTEYRTTMQANPALPWHAILNDHNDDGGLSLTEFRFEDSQRFPLLRMLCFQRLDVNGNKNLEPNECVFRQKNPDAFFSLNEDGTGWKQFYRFETNKNCGCPAVSPDGQSIAFDACPSIQPTQSIFVMPIAGGPPTELETGVGPSWHPDGDHILFYNNRDRPGVKLIDVKKPGTAKFITNGSCGRWAPDGKSIAIMMNTSIGIYDPATGTTRTLAEADDGDYTTFAGRLAWSPDGQKIGFLGMRTGQSGLRDLTTLDVSRKENRFRVHYSGKQTIRPNLGWHPTENRIVFATHCAERQRFQLYEFDPTKDDPPRLFPGQDPTRNNTDACWTPDGKRLIVISGDY